MLYIYPEAPTHLWDPYIPTTCRNCRHTYLVPSLNQIIWAKHLKVCLINFPHGKRS